MSKASQNRFVTVSELCELIGLSKNRFYALQKAGIFPAALRSPLNNRPVFDSALVEQCLGIVRHRVGANGAPWVPNRKNPVVKRAPQKTPGDRRRAPGPHPGDQRLDLGVGHPALVLKLTPAGNRLPRGHRSSDGGARSGSSSP